MERKQKIKRAKAREKTRGDWGRAVPGVQIVERKRKIKLAKEQEKTRALSERLEQAKEARDLSCLLYLTKNLFTSRFVTMQLVNSLPFVLPLVYFVHALSEGASDCNQVTKTMSGYISILVNCCIKGEKSNNSARIMLSGDAECNNCTFPQERNFHHCSLL